MPTDYRTWRQIGPLVLRFATDGDRPIAVPMRYPPD
jgi:hypothetical protein